MSTSPSGASGPTPAAGYEFLDGNEAVARGAARAGCDFFAGYPITPASSILAHVMDLLPSRGGVVIQAEDEIASLGMCIGAAMAGRRAMTATSGPGISLMSENLGFAIMAEAPLVIVDVQRQGPATGSATKGAEGDVMFVRWGTSGGLPIVVYSPTSVADSFTLAVRAFRTAEAYRVPVVLLTSKEIGLTKERADLASLDPGDPPPRRTPAPGAEPHGFERPADVPPLVSFGAGAVARTTTSTHGRDALLTADPAVIREMISHYEAKIEAAADELAITEEDADPGAEVLVLSYGVVSRAAREAVADARRGGLRVSSFVTKTLWPVPEARIRRALAGVRRVVVPEMNLGQYVREVERLAPRDVRVVRVNRMDTTLIPPDEIRAAIGEDRP